MVLVFALKGHLQRQVSVSSKSAHLYKTVVKLIEHMDLIINEVMEIFVFNDQLLRQVSASTYSSTYADLYCAYVSYVDFREDMDLDLINKDVMEIIAVKDQLERQVLASTDSSTSADLHESLQKVIEDMDLIKKEVMEIVELKDQLPRQVPKSGVLSTSLKMLTNNSSASYLSRLNNTIMVDFDDVMLQLMEKLIYGEPGRQVIPIVGMGGIGKTTLAINVYRKTVDSHHFDICAWVTISQQFNTKELLCEILSQANKKELSQMSEEDEIGVSLHKCLSYRRYLIVLDDLWSIEPWEKLQRYFPNNSNGSRIMVTTRLLSLGSQLDNIYSLEMKFMDEEKSWNMFCRIVFGQNTCPLELENIGKTIVKCCRGLPISIVLMGGVLAKVEPTKECWKSIKRNINSLVNLENDKHSLKILKLSYNHLPVYLKPCFLYLGMYEEDCKIRVSRVIKLWASEGFLRPISGKSLETIAEEYLYELVDRNLILVDEVGRTGKIKYCKMHDLLRDLCLREAQNERFYDVVSKHSPQGTCSQRRVVILENTPEEKVFDVMKSRPYVRTCMSDHERVQLFPNLRLLRTLTVANEQIFGKHHVYSIGNVFELVNLRLLVVYPEKIGQLPSSINLLWSLQTLIINSREVFDIPVGIWKMPQLRHVHFWDRFMHLPDPPSDSIVVMENLQTLQTVRNFKCDEMIVRRIPNIKKLGLCFDEDEGIEFRDDHFCVHNIEHLQKLETLSYHCRCSNFSQKLTFPYSLKSLTLVIKNGRMEGILEKVSTLPLLQKLKLEYGSSTTGKWETVDGQFLSLKVLDLNWKRLEIWTMESSHFPVLEHLTLSYMNVLKEIPAEVGEIPTLKSVMLSDCSESMVKSVKRMVEEQEELQGEDQLSFKVVVRLLKENEELQSLANSNFQVATGSRYDL